MKKIITLLTMTAIIWSALYSGSTAKALVVAQAQTETILLENGDYLEETITDVPVYSSGISILSTAKTITKTKTAKYKNASGKVLWSVSIRATFTYDGSTSKCTSCSHSTTCPAKTWKIKSVSSSKSGNSATAKVTATQTSESESRDFTKSVTIKCSKNGTVS